MTTTDLEQLSREELLARLGNLHGGPGADAVAWMRSRGWAAYT